MVLWSVALPPAGGSPLLELSCFWKMSGYIDSNSCKPWWQVQRQVAQSAKRQLWGKGTNPDQELWRKRSEWMNNKRASISSSSRKERGKGGIYTCRDPQARQGALSLGTKSSVQERGRVEILTSHGKESGLYHDSARRPREGFNQSTVVGRATKVVIQLNDS